MAITPLWLISLGFGAWRFVSVIHEQISEARYFTPDQFLFGPR
jgi:hypothetical protein